MKVTLQTENGVLGLVSNIKLNAVLLLKIQHLSFSALHVASKSFQHGYSVRIIIPTSYLYDTYSLVLALPAISMIHTIEARKGLGTRLWIICNMKKHAHILKIFVLNF